LAVTAHRSRGIQDIALVAEHQPALEEEAPHGEQWIVDRLLPFVENQAVVEVAARIARLATDEEVAQDRILSGGREAGAHRIAGWDGDAVRRDAGKAASPVLALIQNSTIIRPMTSGRCGLILLASAPQEMGWASSRPG